MIETMSVTYSIADSYLASLSHVLDLIPREPLAHAIDVLLDAQSKGKRVYVIGNGGSAATASHLVCDLSKTARSPGTAPVRAFALADNAAVVTAWANDTAFERTFAEQIVGVAEPGDIVIAISASGNSPNIVAGLHAAAEMGVRTIGLLGFTGGAALDLVDIAIHVPCSDYGLVEDSHAAIGHAMTMAVREAGRAGD